MKKIAIVIATIAFSAVSAGAYEARIVTDPITGVEMAVSEINWQSLTTEQRNYVRDQIKVLREERAAARKEARRERMRNRLEGTSSSAQERHQEMQQGMGGTGGMGSGGIGGSMRP